MFKYKKLLVVAYDQEKTQSALAHVSQILSENNVSFVTYTPKTDLPSTNGIDFITVIGGDGSMLSAAKIFNILMCLLWALILVKLALWLILIMEVLIKI